MFTFALKNGLIEERWMIQQKPDLFSKEAP